MRFVARFVVRFVVVYKHHILNKAKRQNRNYNILESMEQCFILF